MTGAALDFMERHRREVCKPKPGGGWLCECGGEIEEQDFCCRECREKRDEESRAEKRKRWEDSVRSSCFNAFQAFPNWAHTKSAAAFDEVVTEKRLRSVVARWKGGSSILFLGPSGCGKSSTAIRLIRSLEEERVAARLARPDDKGAEQALSDLARTRWFTAFELIRALGPYGNEIDAEPIRKAADAPLLIIDELGPETPKHANVIFDILDRRYTKGLPTVATSGLTLPDFLVRYGHAMFRRLTEKRSGLLIDLHSQRGNVGK